MSPLAVTAGALECWLGRACLLRALRTPGSSVLVTSGRDSPMTVGTGHLPLRPGPPSPSPLSSPDVLSNAGSKPSCQAAVGSALRLGEMTCWTCFGTGAVAHGPVTSQSHSSRTRHVPPVLLLDGTLQLATPVGTMRVWGGSLGSDLPFFPTPHTSPCHSIRRTNNLMVKNSSPRSQTSAQPFTISVTLGKLLKLCPVVPVVQWHHRGTWRPLWAFSETTQVQCLEPCLAHGRCGACSLRHCSA